LTKPIQGAEKNGAVGFASGIAKGVGNAIFKPTAGAYS
jgi:ribosomal protein S5